LLKEVSSFKQSTRDIESLRRCFVTLLLDVISKLLETTNQSVALSLVPKDFGQFIPQLLIQFSNDSKFLESVLPLCKLMFSSGEKQFILSPETIYTMISTLENNLKSFEKELRLATLELLSLFVSLLPTSSDTSSLIKVFFFFFFFFFFF